MYVGLRHEKTCLCQFGGRPTHKIYANAQLDMGMPIANISSFYTFLKLKAYEREGRVRPTHSYAGSVYKSRRGVLHDYLCVRIV